jgi:hypothetical protein
VYFGHDLGSGDGGETRLKLQGCSGVRLAPTKTEGKYEEFLNFISKKYYGGHINYVHIPVSAPMLAEE